jgi:hypothetical protein
VPLGLRLDTGLRCALGSHLRRRLCGPLGGGPFRRLGRCAPGARGFGPDTRHRNESTLPRSAVPLPRGRMVKRAWTGWCRLEPRPLPGSPRVPRPLPNGERPATVSSSR